MTDRDHFTRTLSAVIGLAVDVINRPALGTREASISDLTEKVDAARLVMVEGGNPIRGEVPILLEVLSHIEAERTFGSERAGDFCMVAGVLLVMVRRNLLSAMKLATRAPATTDHDFTRGKP